MFWLCPHTKFVEKLRNKKVLHNSGKVMQALRSRWMSRWWPWRKRWTIIFTTPLTRGARAHYSPPRPMRTAFQKPRNSSTRLNVQSSRECSDSSQMEERLLRPVAQRAKQQVATLQSTWRPSRLKVRSLGGFLAKSMPCHPASPKSDSDVYSELLSTVAERWVKKVAADRSYV